MMIKLFKKYFNILSKEQEEKVAADVKEMTRLAMREEDREKERIKEKRKVKDSTCPNCQSTLIVNKIAHVIGSGSMRGSFSGFGGGYMSGSSSTDTNEVNHCNKCGNEWKKATDKYDTWAQILGERLNYIFVHCKGKHTYGDATALLFKDFSAESIFKLLEEYDHTCYYDTKHKLTLKLLRTKFKSIHDEESR